MILKNQRNRLRASSSLIAVAVFLCVPQFHIAAEKNGPVFTKDILPILQEKCQACHRPGQIAPMSLLSYKEVRPWVKSIQKEVAAKNMPPFHAKSPIGYFKDDPRLSDSEIQSIVDWVSKGAPEGNRALAPKPINWEAKGWSMGKPDQVLTFPKFTTETENPDDFVLVYSDHVFSEDTWIQAIEFKTSDYKIVHHAGVFAVNSKFAVPDNFMLLNTEGGKTDRVVNKSVGLLKQNFLYTWLPGQKIEYRDQGQGYLIHKGERFVLQVHMAPYEGAGECELQLGLKMVNGEITEQNISLPSIMKTLEVPPNDPSYNVNQSARFVQDVVVRAYMVHMHLRGKSSKFLFHYPDGTTETAFDVPEFSFDWQRVYHLAEPKKVPRGTQVVFYGEWDNSAGNPINPNPNVSAKWGMNTADEMYGGTVFYTVKLDKPFTVKNGHKVN